MRRHWVVPLLFGVLGTGILIALGVWQLHRLGEKEAELAAIDARIADAPVALPETPGVEEDRYLAVAATGELGEPEIHVLISTRDLGAGYRLIQPFEVGDRRILLDRGFIELEDKDAERPLGRIAVTGNLHWPDEVNDYTPERDRGRNIWFARDVPAMAEALDAEPVLLIVRSATPEQSGDPIPLPVDSAAIPNDHLEYVITWFSLALVWAGMTGYLIWRGARQEKGKTV